MPREQYCENESDDKGSKCTMRDGVSEVLDLLQNVSFQSSWGRNAKYYLNIGKLGSQGHFIQEKTEITSYFQKGF